MFESSLSDLYTERCRSTSTTPNKVALSRMQQLNINSQELDLRHALIGSKGLSPILYVVERMPELTCLNLESNNLVSEDMSVLSVALIAHPALNSLVLCGNDIRLGGPDLVKLVKRNCRITSIDIKDTYLRQLFVRLIDINCTRNKSKCAFGNTSFPSVTPIFKQSSAFRDPQEDPFSTPTETKPTGVHFAAGTQGSKKIRRRPTVFSEVYKEKEIDEYEVGVQEKPAHETRWLHAILDKHDLFSHLEDYELEVAVNAMCLHTYHEGDVMFRCGDTDRDEFFVIASGEVEVTNANGDVSEITRGSTTQQIMLMYSSITTETATCKSKVTAYSLSRQTYKVVLSRASKKKRAMYEGFLSTVGFLKDAQLSRHELLQLADSLKPASYNSGDVLISYGQEGEAFFIIVEGVVEVFGRDDDKQVIKVCEFSVGDCVGELEFINHHRCVADVKAKTFVRTAMMNRHHFELVIGPVRDVLARNASTNTVYQYYRKQLEKMTK